MRGRAVAGALAVLALLVLGTAGAGAADPPASPPSWDLERLQSARLPYDPARTRVYESAREVPVTIAPAPIGTTHPITTARSVRIAQGGGGGTLPGPGVPTTITVTGGSQTVAKRLTAGQSAFSINVPLRPNAENTLRVEAVDTTGRRDATEVKITQFSLSDILVARVTAQRLTVEEVKALVADGTINVADPQNFNVSVFDIVLRIGGTPVPVRLPVVQPKTDPVFGVGPPITIGCARPGRGLTTTETAIAIPCGSDGGATPTFQVQVIDIPLPPEVALAGEPSIPGVIIIEGRIKTLKEFFKVKLLLMNVSSLFTLEEPMAALEVPEGALTPIVPASGPIALRTLPPGTEDSGEFIVRGDRVGTHTVTANFGGFLSGLGIPGRIPVSGRASTDLEVKGPPPMTVKVTHPDRVVRDEPYPLTVQITNTSPDLPALYTSLELDVGGDARLLDAETGQEREGPQVETLGDILPGQSVTRSFLVKPLKTGPITSCTGGASQNLTLKVAFTGSANLPCAVGTFPASRAETGGKPTVAVVPPHNTVDVSPLAAITAIFSATMATETITSGFADGTFVVQAPDGAVVTGTLQFGTVFSGTVAFFLPAAPLAFGTTYTINVSPSIFDVDGNALASGMAARFTTSGAPIAADFSAPTVTVAVDTAVVNPAAVPRGAVVPLVVEAADDTAIDRVELLFDGAVVDLKRGASPFRFTFDTARLSPGASHAFLARGFDLAGNVGVSGAAAITMAPDTSPPAVSIGAAESIARGRTLSVTIEATDDGRVARVELYVDGGALPVFAGTLAPFLARVATAGLAGEHTLRAVAVDVAGNTAQATRTFVVTDDPQGPVVAIISPTAAEQVVKGTVLPVTYTAVDDIGVAGVEAFLDAETTPRSTAPGGFNLATADLAAGDHVVRVKARDLAGNVTTAEAAFTVFVTPLDTTPPAAPDAGRIQAGIPVNGVTTVTGQPGAAEPGSRVSILNLGNQSAVQVTVAGDGSFAGQIEGAPGQTISVTATDPAGNTSGAATLFVPAPPSLLSIAVSPAAVGLNRLVTQQPLTVTGTFSDGSSRVLTTGLLFTSGDPQVAAVSAAGLVLPGRNGDTSIAVRSGDVPATPVPVTVAFPTLVAVEVTPATIAFRDVGRTQQLALTARLSDTSVQPFAGTVGYSSGDPAVASVTSGGLVRATGEGGTTITVTPEGFPALTVTVTAERRRLVSLSAAPPSTTFLVAGTTQQLQVTGAFSDDTTADLTAAATGTTHESSDASVATVSAGGLVTATGNGTATITARNADRQATATVRGNFVTALALQPPAVTLFPGGTRSFQAIATLADGATTALGAGVAFASSDGGVATVDGGGTVTAVAVGDATLTARFAGVPDATASVTVRLPQPTAIAVSPASIGFTAAGETRQVAVTVTLEDGSTRAPQGPVDFATDAANVATVTAEGLVSAVANGTATITTGHAGLTATVAVTVDIPVANPPPVITAIDRPRAGEGDPFTLRGRNFGAAPGQNLVTVNGLVAEVTAARQDELTAIVPPGAATGSVVVSTGGQASNAVALGIYPRRARSVEITPGIDIVAGPGDTVRLRVPGVEFRTGDAVLLSSAPDIAAPIGFAGTLTAAVGARPPRVLPLPGPDEAVDLTEEFTPGVQDLTLELSEFGGRITTGPIYLLAGPDDTGPIAGERSTVALGRSRPTPVTFIELRNVDGTPLPDGALVAVSVADLSACCFGVTAPDGSCCVRSAGGTIASGDANPEGGHFKTFTVLDGRIDVLYDPQGAAPLAAAQGATAVVQVFPAGATGQRIGTRAIALGTVGLTTLDTAATPRSQSAAIADGLSKIVTVRLTGLRDAAGHAVPDGEKVAVSAHDLSVCCFGVTAPDGSCCVRSAGGAIVNGVNSTEGGHIKILEVSGGQVEIQYDPGGVLVPVGEVRTASVQVFPATPGGARVGSRAFVVVPITLSSASGGEAQIAVVPPSVLADGADRRVVVTVTGLLDAAGNPAPDGTRLAVSAHDLSVCCFGVTAPDGSCCVRSAGGAIVNGANSTEGAHIRIVEVTSGQAEITYSDLGVALAAGQSATARVQIFPATPGGARIGARAIAVADVTLTGYQTASGNASPPSAIADGLSKIVTVTLTGVRDTAGNPVPDGAKVAVSARDLSGCCFNVTAPDGSCCVRSAGGTIVNGTNSTEGAHIKILESSGGRVEIQYDPGGTLLAAGDVQTANVQVFPARPDGSRIGDRVFVVVPITLSAPSAPGATITVTPASVLADGADRRVVATISGLVDALGHPAPDGTRLAVSAHDLSACCFNVTAPDGSCCVRSHGGSIVSGVDSTEGAHIKIVPVQGGQVEVVYSDVGIALGATETRTARIQVFPATPGGARIGSRALALADVALAGVLSGDPASGPGQVSRGGSATYTFVDLVDAAGQPLPDGAKVAVSATNLSGCCFGVTAPDGTCCLASAGGTITAGSNSTEGAHIKIVEVQGGAVTVEFTAPAVTGTSVIQLFPATPQGARIGSRVFAIKAIDVTP